LYHDRAACERLLFKIGLFKRPSDISESAIRVAGAVFRRSLCFDSGAAIAQPSGFFMKRMHCLRGAVRFEIIIPHSINMVVRLYFTTRKASQNLLPAIGASRARNCAERLDWVMILQETRPKAVGHAVLLPGKTSIPRCCSARRKSAPGRKTRCGRRSSLWRAHFLNLALMELLPGTPSKNAFI